MGRGPIILKKEFEEAIAAYVGYHLTEGMMDVDLESDAEDSPRIWTVAVCNKLKKCYKQLSDDELECLAVLYAQEVLRAVYPGAKFTVLSYFFHGKVVEEEYIKIGIYAEFWGEAIP